MRRFTSVFGMLLAVLWLPIAMMAKSESVFSMVHNPKQETAKVTRSEYKGSPLQVLDGNAILKAEKAEKSSVKQLRNGKKTKAISSTADLKGSYVLTYKSLTTTGNDGGSAVTVKAVTGSTTDITITNFWQKDIVVNGSFSASTKKITIKNQKLGTTTDADGNTIEFDLAVVTSSGVADRTADITATVNADGTITFDTWWAIFVATSDKQAFGFYYGTEMVKSNATMSYRAYSSDLGMFGNESFAVYVEQPSKNVLSVRNFGNYGQTVEVALNRDLSAKIESQVARKDATNGDWYTKSATFAEDYSKLTSYSNDIICEKATDKRTISWGDWTLLCTKYYLGARVEGKITTTFDISYPELAVSEFEGEGTETNPYKIKSLDDLILLSDRVNTSEELNYGTTTKYARVYLGKYFSMENDIDMSNYRFDPIGADWQHQFAGTFDGNGHTITGLTINTGSKGYAGLFGKADTLSVIKNVKFDKATVENAGYYAGVVCAWSLGNITNCSVTNSVVSNTGNTGAAGITALGQNIYDCSVTTSNITGAGGYAAGVAGQVSGEIKNCYAVNVLVRAGGVTETYPSGGVVGSLYKGKAENCYFSGTVDGRYQSNLSIGGVAGTCFLGSIDRCYATGSVYGWDTKAAVGGVVGNLYGTVTNSYSNSVVISASSRYSGGIAGYVRFYKDNDGVITESAIKNCYTAGTLVAETYQYNPETERREVIGTILEGANPTIENIYFDKQMVDFKSTEYSASTAELTSGSGVKGFDPDIWVFTEGNYPRLKGMEDTEAAKFSASALVLDPTSVINNISNDAKLNLLGNTQVKYIVNGAIVDNGQYSSIVGNDLKLGVLFGTDSLYFVSDKVGARIIPIKIAPNVFEGTGTQDDPFLIKNKEELIKLSKASTITMQLFDNTYFKIVNDIDLEKDPEFLGICASMTTKSTDAHVQFKGHIDGGGHFIHNMYLKDCVVWSEEPSEGKLGTIVLGGDNGSLSYKGFIGRLHSEGSVKNLNIAADCSLTNLFATSAAVVGYNYGLVENCKNYADINGYSCWIGGIVGQNTKTGVIRNCYNAGKVSSGYMNAGGITGSNYGLIENCENAGDITVDIRSTSFSNKLTMAGGIAGGSTGGRFINCVNSGTVKARYGRAGGISASLAKVTGDTYIYFNDVINCINYGTVLSDDKVEVGAIGGVSGSEGTNKDTYYDGQITVYQANGGQPLEGASPAETSVFTSGNAFENYSSDIWSFDAGKYPVLKQFADEDLVKATRSIIINVAAGETVSNLKSDIQLCEGSWSLVDGKTFKIEGNKVVVPASVTALSVDTLVYTSGNVVKPFVIIARPSIPLTGSGTVEDPYLINNATDWNAITEYIAVCAEPMDEKVFKLTNDIDFSVETIKPFSYDGVTTFNGILDGNGKTVKATLEGVAAKSALAFKSLGKDAIVKNLTVDGEITSANGSLAGVVYDLYGTLENVTNKATVTNTAKTYVAGVVGVAETGAKLYGVVNQGKVTSAGTYLAGLVGTSNANVRYENCYNEGTINFTGGATGTSITKAYVAGLIAYCYNDTLIGCYNTGEIVLDKPSNTGYISGLIGYANATNNSEPYYIKGCFNTADISSAANNAGLIIDTNASGYARFVMEDCYNTGDISSTAAGTVTSTYTAGLVTLYTSGSVYRNCWNKGTVLSQKPVYAAGIAAYNKGTFNATSSARFVNCYNTGDIIASGNQGGGIVASLSGYCEIDSCYNVGNVEGGFGLGGIVAALSGQYTKVKNCWNAGTITTSTYRAGGIIGYNSASNAEITNCYNVGEISTTSTEAKNNYGIGGIAGQGAGHFKNVYNAGNVKGVAQVGGLIGYTSKGTVSGSAVNGTTVENAYFSGKIDAPADTCGMIIGIKTVDNGKSWNANNFVKNAYYASENKVETVNDEGTAAAYADLTKISLGESWTKYDNFCLPVLRDISDNAYAKVNSVAVVPADGDTYQSITKEFNVGVPEGVTITTDNADVIVIGNEVKFSKPFTGTLNVTANATSDITEDPATVSKTITLTCDVKEASGINDVNADGKTVVNEVFYNVAGVEVAEPAKGEKAVYIVVKTYDDGTTETVKEVR